MSAGLLSEAFYIPLVFHSLAFAAPVLAIYAPLGMAPLVVIGAAAIGAAAIATRQRLPLPIPHIFLWLIGCLLAWAIASAAWSINPGDTVKTAFQMIGVSAATLALLGGTACLKDTQARQIMRSLAAGIAVALAIYVIEIIFHSPIQSLFRQLHVDLEGIYSPFNRGLSVLVLTLTPCFIGLRRQGRLWIAVTLCLGSAAVVYSYFGTSVQVGLTFGILAVAVAMIRPAIVVPAMGACLALSIAAAPFLTATFLTKDLIATISSQTAHISASHRLVIWQFTASQVLERPLTGWGLDAARAMPQGKELVPLGRKDCEEPCPIRVEQLPLHPHNFALQWWLELGFPGAALGGACLFLIFLNIPRLRADRFEQALLAGQATAGVTIAGLGYGSWQSWWLATIVLAITMSRIALVIQPADSMHSI